MKNALIIAGAGLLGGFVGFGLGYGDEALDGDYWRREYEELMATGSRRVAQACGRANPPADVGRRRKRYLASA